MSGGVEQRSLKMRQPFLQHNRIIDLIQKHSTDGGKQVALKHSAVPVIVLLVFSERTNVISVTKRKDTLLHNCHNISKPLRRCWAMGAETFGCRFSSMNGTITSARKEIVSTIGQSRLFSLDCLSAHVSFAGLGVL